MGDRIIYTQRERALSRDLVDLQALQNRANAMLASGVSSPEKLSGITARPPNAWWVAGLSFAYVSGGIRVNGGMVGVLQPTYPSTPGPLDSPYRIGAMYDYQDIPLGPVGANTWYIIEARVGDALTLQEPRDVYDPATGTFVPTLVEKRREYQLELRARSNPGNPNNIPTLDPDWVPLWAVEWTPANQAGRVEDLRVTLQDVLQDRPSQAFARSQRCVMPHTTTTAVRVEAVVETYSGRAGVLANMDGGFVLGSQLIDVVDPEILEPGAALTDFGWHYLYVAPWTSSPGGDYEVWPRNVSSLLVTTQRRAVRGVLVLSPKPPDYWGRNSQTLNLPPPFSAYTAGAGTAACIASLNKRPGVNAWVPGSQVDGDATVFNDPVNQGFRLYETAYTQNATASFVVFPSLDNLEGILGAPMYPAGARQVLVDMHVQALRNSGAFWSYELQVYDPSLTRQVVNELGSRGGNTHTFWWDVEHWGTTIPTLLQANAGTVNWTVEMFVRGWRR